LVHSPEWSARNTTLFSLLTCHQLSDLVVFTKKCSWFLHILPSSIIIYHGLPMFTMGYDGLPCNLPWMEPEITICVQATTAAATNLHPPAWSKKKTCGQMWPPETG